VASTEATGAARGADPAMGGSGHAVTITPPFFEIGPKAYTWGREMLDLAGHAADLGLRWGVRIIVTPQHVDIPLIASEVPGVLVFAQHMDALRPGRGVGAVLPEAVKAAGAAGVLLNHAERRLSREDLALTMHRAAEVGLATMVCADDAADAAEVARLGPDVIIVEAPDLIGAGSSAGGARASVAGVDEAIRRVDPGIRILHGAGIGNARDVFDVIAAGAQGTGSSSAIFTAPDPHAMLAEMVRAVRAAWDATHGGRGDRP
jgi:triosephosphate isomerase (TIM)